MGENIRILIVDDDPGMTETLADILSDMGHDVAMAGDGYRAIELIEDNLYDVVLMDVKMPGINGVETFKRVKRISPSTRFIMMTAYSLEDLLNEALEEGAYGIFYKPLDIDKVADLIEQAGRGAFVLVVDDEPNTCETIKDILEEKGFNVSMAHSGEEAIKCAREKTHDIVFIDLKMPILNGLETYLVIKDVNPKITAVMMTGYRQEVEELVEEAIKNSAYTCLYKPLEMGKVVALVGEICRRKREGVFEKAR